MKTAHACCLPRHVLAAHETTPARLHHRFFARCRFFSVLATFALVSACAAPAADDEDDDAEGDEPVAAISDALAGCVLILRKERWRWPGRFDRVVTCAPSSASRVAEQRTGWYDGSSIVTDDTRRRDCADRDGAALARALRCRAA